MRVWLVTIGEPLPIISEDARLLRAGMLAEELVSRGHKVIWWTSTFDHSKKQQLFPVDKTIDLSESFCIHLLHSVGYKQNISVRRVIDHVGVARKFKYYSHKEPVPDVIICSISVTWANAMLGEVTPRIAEAVTSCSAPKIVLPLTQEHVKIVGVIAEPLPHMVQDIVEVKIKEVLKDV